MNALGVTEIATGGEAVLFVLNVPRCEEKMLSMS